MAEVVQFHLEGMVPELEEYIKLGVFTKEEVRSIVKRRTNFEYLIKKRNPSCQVCLFKLKSWNFECGESLKLRK